MSTLPVEVAPDLVDDVVRHVRRHLGPAAASALARQHRAADLVLEAACALTCAGEFPPPPLGTEMLEIAAQVDRP